MRGVLLERGVLTGAKLSTRPEKKTDFSARWSSKSDEQDSERPWRWTGSPKSMSGRISDLLSDIQLNLQIRPGDFTFRTPALLPLGHRCSSKEQPPESKPCSKKTPNIRDPDFDYYSPRGQLCLSISELK